MIITNKVKLDLQTPGILPTIHAVQNDSYSRNLEIILFSDRKPFIFPDNGAVVIRYKKSDGKGGEYDTLPDGTAAWRAERNVLTVALAPQVLTTPGSVHLSVSLIAGGTQLSIFPIHLAVAPIAAGKIAKSENYFYITGLLPAPVSGNVGQCLRIAAVNAEGRITAVEATDSESFNAATVCSLPVLHLTGDTTGMSKDNAVSLDYVYGERSGTATVTWQGSSSLAYPKKNYTIQFDNAFEAVEGWGVQDKYCLKANFIDHSHARNVVSAKLWGEIVKSRDMPLAFVYDKDTLISTPNDVAYSFEDGVLTSNFSMVENGAFFLTDAKLPDGGYDVTCDVYFPDGATDLKIVAYYYRKDTGVEGYVNANAATAGVWETITISTIWASGSETFLSLSGMNTNGVKFRNIRFNGLYGVKSIDYMPIKQIQTLPNGGAVDGFPCVVMLNGAFHGLYTFNLPKDGWMFGMNDGSIPQAILCADTQNEACGFKALATLTDDFDLEYVSDDNDSDWVLTSLNTLISAVMNSDGTDLDTTVAKYLDWNSAIDYLIFSVLLRGTDMYRKNYLLVTYDGTKWFFSAYDMDSTYGMHWDGNSFDSASGYPLLNDYNHRVMELIYTYKKNELLARYEEIRNTVMSEDNVALAFSNFINKIPSTVYMEDAKKWPGIPSTAANNLAQILNWYRMRVAVLDKEVERMA